MLRKIYLILFAFLMVAPGFGQQVDAVEKPKEDVKLFYRSDWTLGFFLHSRGMGGSFRYGQHLTGKKKRLWTVDILNMRHPKEKKINRYGEGAKGYRYGKLNTFTNVRIGIGRQKVIYGKEIKKGVEISLIYTAGFSFGFVKPVYLEIISPTPGVGQFITERYDPEKHNLNNIFGRASIFKGVGEMKVIPGIHGRFGFNFEYAPYDERIKSLEVGVIIDAYYKEVPIMYDTYNNQFWITVYVAYQFGKKII